LSCNLLVNYPLLHSTRAAIVNKPSRERLHSF